MGRYTEIEIPKSYLNYARQIPEKLLFESITNIDKNIAENDSAVDTVLKNLNIKVAPSNIAQKDYQDYTKGILDKKNIIIDDIQKDKLNFNKHRASIKNLSEEISQSLVNGKLRALQDQYNQYTSLDEKLKTDYKDTPEIYNLGRQKLMDSISDKTYNPDLNTYGNITPPNMVAHVKQDDIVKHYEGLIKTIADKTQLSDLEVKRILRKSASDLVGIGGNEKISYDKVREALVGGTLNEHVNSLNQYNEAIYGKEFVNNVNEKDFFKEGKLNLNTQLGRIIHGLSVGAEQEKVQVTQMSNANPNAKESSSKETQQAVDPIHSWGVYNSKFNSLLKTATQSDPDTRALVIKQVNNIANRTMDGIFDPRKYKDNPEIVKGGSLVYPFDPGVPVINDSKKGQINNTFLQNDIAFNVKTGKVYIYDEALNNSKYINVPFNPNIKPGINFDLKNPSKATTTGRSYNRTFDVNNKNDMKQLKEYIFQKGVLNQQFYPSPTYYGSSSFDFQEDNIE